MGRDWRIGSRSVLRRAGGGVISTTREIVSSGISRPLTVPLDRVACFESVQPFYLLVNSECDSKRWYGGWNKRLWKRCRRWGMKKVETKARSFGDWLNFGGVSGKKNLAEGRTGSLGGPAMQKNESSAYICNLSRAAARLYSEYGLSLAPE